MREADRYLTIRSSNQNVSQFSAVLEVPKITFMSEQQRVREGDSVTIDCVARGIPPPSVSISLYEDLQVTATPRLSADNRTYEVSFSCVTAGYCTSLCQLTIWNVTSSTCMQCKAWQLWVTAISSRKHMRYAQRNALSSSSFAADYVHPLVYHEMLSCSIYTSCNRL